MSRRKKSSKMDAKELLYFTILIFVLLSLATFLPYTPPSVQLSELQIMACNTADQHGTCDSRLAEVGIVLSEECCQALGKCCG